MRIATQRILVLFCIYAFTACNNSAQQETAPVTVKEVKVGNQIWATSNLDVTRFRNGDPVPELRSAEEWAKAGNEGKPGWCYYENDAKNGQLYGKMYNWYAVNDPRGLAPPGWRVPTNQEWITLEDHLGVPEAAVKLKSRQGWDANGNGDDSSGLSIMPGGYRDRNGRFTGKGEFLYLSGSTEKKLQGSDDNKTVIWGRGIQFENKWVMRCELDKEFGLYVRCIKDKN